MMNKIKGLLIAFLLTTGLIITSCSFNNSKSKKNEETPQTEDNLVNKETETVIPKYITFDLAFDYVKKDSNIDDKLTEMGYKLVEHETYQYYFEMAGSNEDAVRKVFTNQMGYDDLKFAKQNDFGSAVMFTNEYVDRITVVFAKESLLKEFIAKAYKVGFSEDEGWINNDGNTVHSLSLLFDEFNGCSITYYNKDNLYWVEMNRTGEL